MFNRLTWAKNLCEFLSDNGCDVILLDNGSTYPPLLEWYKKCPYKTYFFSTQHYNRTLWQSGILKEDKDKNYIVTDPDLDLSSVPHDFVDKLLTGLKNNPDVMKSGLSLKIDDLPENEYTKKVIEWEKKWWEKPQDKNGFYLADIDTTLAIYDSERVERMYHSGFFLAVRSPKPYEARHCGWYFTPETITEEEKYYINHVVMPNRGHWTNELKKELSK